MGGIGLQVPAIERLSLKVTRSRKIGIRGDVNLLAGAVLVEATTVADDGGVTPCRPENAVDMHGIAIAYLIAQIVTARTYGIGSDIGVVRAELIGSRLSGNSS